MGLDSNAQRQQFPDQNRDRVRLPSAGKPASPPLAGVDEHARELAAILAGSAQRVLPIVIFVEEETGGALVGFLEAGLRSCADGCDESRPVGYVSIASKLKTRRPIDGSEQALGWVVTGKGEDESVAHEGATWGYASYIAWEPRTRRGVVVLSNQLTAVADIGNHLLKPSTPLEPPTITRHAEINLESKILDAYAGHDAKEEGVFLIVRERDSLTIQLPIGWGIPKFRLRPESPRDFFVAELPIRATFQTDSSGQVNGILVYPPRGQHALPANRITPPK